MRAPKPLRKHSTIMCMSTRSCGSSSLSALHSSANCGHRASGTTSRLSNPVSSSRTLECHPLYRPSVFSPSKMVRWDQLTRDPQHTQHLSFHWVSLAVMAGKTSPVHARMDLFWNPPWIKVPPVSTASQHCQSVPLRIQSLDASPIQPSLIMR